MTSIDKKANLPGPSAPVQQPRWRLYALAVAVTAATLLLRLALASWIGDRPVLILFVIPIIFSAYVGGLGPGLVATALVALGTNYFLLPPTGSFAIERPADLAQWLILVLVGALISVLSDAPQRPRRGWPSDQAGGTYRSTERKMQAGFGFALACLAVVGVVSYLSVVRLNENAAWVEHTREVIGGLDFLLSKTTDAQNGHRGYAVTGDETYLEPYLEAVQTAADDVRRLLELTADNPAQQRRLEQLAALVDAQLAFSREVIEARRSDGFAAARKLMLTGKGKQLHDQFRGLINEMKNAEESLLKARELQARRDSTVTQAVIVGGMLLAFGFVALALIVIRRDIAGRQQAEAELERFFTLSLDFLCIASSDGYFKRVSPAVTGILGWSVEEFLARPFLDFVHPDDHAATLREVEKQIVGGENVVRFENRYRHKDGSWRVLSWRSIPQPGGLMYATARDATERRQMEQALRAANENLELRVRERTAELAQSSEMLRNNEIRFRSLIEHGSDSIALIDETNKILYLSPAVTAVEGYTPEELIGRSGIEHTHPDDLPVVQEVVQRLLANPGKPIPVLWRRRHKNGQWLWLEGVATNLLDDPAVRAIVTNYRDVSERKQAEDKIRGQLEHLNLLDRITRSIGERLDLESIFQVVVRTLEDSMPVDFCCIGLHDQPANALRIARVGVKSEALARELTLDAHASVGVDDNGLGRCMQGQLVYEPDVSQVRFPFPERLLRGGLRSVVMAPLRSESRVFGVLVAARREAHGFSSVECEFLRQLSEHVALAAGQAQLHGALQKAYDDLRQSQQAAMQEERLRALGQMASGIAHDINNALSPVSLYTESLLETEPNLSARARGYLETIQRAVEDVAQTVARMREFYRQREPNLVFAPVDVNRLVQQVLALTRARWSDMPQQHGIAIRPLVELAPDLPKIMAAESEIREALTNLVFNAVDAMPNGGALTLRTRLADAAKGSERGAVSIEIADEGVGMDEDTRQRCLEPFFTTKGERGTGLGLAMVFGTAQRHSAEIEIESAPDAGTTVRLVFAVPAAADTEPGQPARTPAAPSGLRLLLIDDDPVLLKSLRNTLETDGHAIATANGGKEGISLFRASLARGETFAAVITDLGMPYVDGRKVATAVKEASPATPVILLTGWGQRLIADGDIPPHVDRVLAKPPKLREVREALAHLCRTATA